MPVAGRLEVRSERRPCSVDRAEAVPAPVELPLLRFPLFHRQACVSTRRLIPHITLADAAPAWRCAHPIVPATACAQTGSTERTSTGSLPPKARRGAAMPVASALAASEN